MHYALCTVHSVLCALCSVLCALLSRVTYAMYVRTQFSLYSVQISTFWVQNSLLFSKFGTNSITLVQILNNAPVANTASINTDFVKTPLEQRCSNLMREYFKQLSELAFTVNEFS